jgi:hypothetical protein
VSGFLTSTLTQQAIGFKETQAETSQGQATVARATQCDLFNGSTLDIGPWAAVREKQAVVQGAFHVPDVAIPYVAPDCSTGHCAWKPYGSLGLCSTVANLSEEAGAPLIANLTAITTRRVEALYNRTASFLSDGLIYSIFPSSTVPPSFPVILGPLSGPTGTQNQSVNELLLGSYFLAYSDTLLTAETVRGANFKFLEVSYHWCTKTYLTEVKAGLHNTTRIGTMSKSKSSRPHVLNFAWAPDFGSCYVQGTCHLDLGGLAVELEPPPGVEDTDERYWVNVWSSLMGSIIIGETMHDSILMDATRGIVTSMGGGISQSFASSLFGDYMATESPDRETQTRNIRGILDNLEVSMTN